MKKKILKLYSELKKDKSLRVKKSYYTFSKEYPAGNIPIKRKKNKKFHSGFFRVLTLCLMCAFLVCLSFFVISLGLEISNKEPSPVADTSEVKEESLLVEDGVKALYMPYEHLGDTRYIRSFVKELRKKDCNSVVIVFKTSQGKLNYSSRLDYAIKGKCSVFYNDTVRSAVDLFSENDISVIAKLYCFEDPSVASSSPELAIKYMDTDINWLDGSDENGGKAWLNPYLAENQSYIIGIMQELYSLNIKGFILESCCFPDTGNAETAYFTGKAEADSPNLALRSLFDKAQEALPKDAFILMSYTAVTALDGSEALYGGTLSDASYDGFTADLSVRDESYTVDRKSKFSSMLGLLSLIEASNKGKHFIPVISIDEYSSKYISTIRKAGYTNYIIYDETGEY